MTRYPTQSTLSRYLENQLLFCPIIAELQPNQQYTSIIIINIIIIVIIVIIIVIMITIKLNS